jgi:hypothetical protein
VPGGAGAGAAVKREAADGDRRERCSAMTLFCEPTMTPQDFVAKWRPVALTER